MDPSQYSDKVMEHFRNPRNVGDIPDADGIGNVGNPVCVVPDTLIHANSQIVEIGKLKQGERVLGHDGRYHSITAVLRRKYRGIICNIDVHNLGTTLVTPEHHILAMKTSRYPFKFEAAGRLIKDFYMADELQKGDLILFPIPCETKDVKYIRLNQPIPKWDFKSKPLPERVKVDKDFLRLIGYYISEGYARTDRCKGTVGFVFGDKETGYIKDVINLMKKLFKIDPAKIETRHNSAHIQFYSARLARFFATLVNKGAQNKRLPHWMVRLPLEKQRALLCGLWRGDGYISKRDRGAKFVTISKQLAYQMKLLLLRQGIIFSFLTVPAKGIHKESYCIYIRKDDSLRKIAKIVGLKKYYFPKVKTVYKSWTDKNYFYTTIDKITREEYDGEVFNLEVQAPHSYTSESLALHNCGDVLRIYLKVKDGVIVDAKFKTFGCGAAISTSSMVTELVKGKTVEEALALSNKAVAEALGGLPPIKMHCSLLAEQGLKSALKDYYERKGLTPPPDIEKVLKKKEHEH